MNHKFNGIIIHPEELNKTWIDRAKDFGLDYLGIHPHGGKEANASVKELLKNYSSPDFCKLLDYAKNKGLAIEVEAHAMGLLLDRNEFNLHPDYFRIDNLGKRNPDLNICPSNEKALEKISENAKLLAKTFYSTSHNYSFWLDDANDGACHCEKCASLSPSDQALLIINAIAKGIKEVDKKSKVYYLAYCDTLTAPTKVKPLDNVFLEYAPFNRNFHKPLTDASCEENVKSIAPLKNLLDFFGRKNSKVLEYWMDNSLYSRYVKPPKQLNLESDMMKKDVAFYDSLGFETITSFGCFLGEDYEKLYGAPPVKEYADILLGK